MELSDERVMLRPPAERDVAFVRAAAVDPYIPQITSIPAGASDADARDWLARQRRKPEETGGWGWVIVDPATDEPLGFTGLSLTTDPGVGQTGYWLLASARGRGFARAALRLVVEWGFRERRLRRIQALIEPWNEASIRVAESAGFRRERLLRGHYRGRDVLVYALPADDRR
jgi:RimJ/RimL family protein N-acetyltransferase